MQFHKKTWLLEFMKYLEKYGYRKYVLPSQEPVRTIQTMIHFFQGIFYMLLAKSKRFDLKFRELI